MLGTVYRVVVLSLTRPGLTPHLSRRHAKPAHEHFAHMPAIAKPRIKNELLKFFALGLQSKINMATQPAPIAPADPPVIKAAGGILQRTSPRGDEVMVVYRKRHQDWTLPRGKVKDGESFQEAAVRERLKKLEAEQKKFDNGMSTSFEVLRIQTDLSNAQLAEIRAILAYTKAQADLERAKGTLLQARGLRLEF